MRSWISLKQTANSWTTVKIIRINPPPKAQIRLAWSNLLNRRSSKRALPRRLQSKVQIAVAILLQDRRGAVDDYKSHSRMTSHQRSPEKLQRGHEIVLSVTWSKVQNENGQDLTFRKKTPRLMCNKISERTKERAHSQRAKKRSVTNKRL